MKTRRYLRDDMGRIVGACDGTGHRIGERVEYGVRGADGVPQIRGIARITSGAAVDGPLPDTVYDLF